MELIKPFELDNDRFDWTGRVRHADVWETLNAARDGDVTKLRALLEREPKLAQCQYWYVSPLHFAVREGHFLAAKLLLDYGADPTLRTLYGGETFLQIAIDRGHDELVDYLRRLVSEKMRSTGETHPIHEAAKNGDIPPVTRLLEVDPSLANRGDKVGRRPLHYAVENAHYELIDTLVLHGAEVDAQGFSSDNRLGGYGFRPVVSALWQHPYWEQRNDYRAAQQLLKLGAEYTMTVAAALGDRDQIEKLLRADRTLCNHQEFGGKRALSAAAERNYIEIVKLLLDAGADPNLAEGGNCPKGFALWAASHFGFFEIAHLLLDVGADPNAYVESSGNPSESAFNREMRELMYRHGGKVGFTQLFHENNVDAVAAVLANAPQKFRNSLAEEGFPHAVSKSLSTLVHMLLNAGVRVPPVLTGCQTYLWHDLELCEVLLQHGMDPNLPNWQSIRPLHHLAPKNNIDGAKLMLKYGADPSLLDEEYRTTPLGWAAIFGAREYAEFLLERFPDKAIHEPSDMPDWARPVAWALRRGHRELADLVG